MFACNVLQLFICRIILHCLQDYRHLHSPEMRCQCHTIEPITAQKDYISADLFIQY